MNLFTKNKHFIYSEGVQSVSLTIFFAFSNKCQTKWKEDHKFCLLGDELEKLNKIIDDLTDRFIDFKDNNNNEGKV